MTVAKCHVFMPKKSLSETTKARCSRRNCGARVVCASPPDKAAAVVGLRIHQCNFCS